MSLEIDSDKCTGCGDCVNVCPEHAITIHDDLAMINEDLCIQCGNCANVCPADAIREVALANIKLSKGGDSMVYGFGRGFGRRGGVGFGFRGSSPPWPYFGRGRGIAMASFFPSVPPVYAPQMPQGQEIDWLKSQAEAIKAELNQVEARMQDLGSAK